MCECIHQWQEVLDGTEQVLFSDTLVFPHSVHTVRSVSIRELSAVRCISSRILPALLLALLLIQRFLIQGPKETVNIN